MIFAYETENAQQQRYTKEFVEEQGYSSRVRIMYMPNGSHPSTGAHDTATSTRWVERYRAERLSSALSLTERWVRV